MGGYGSGGARKNAGRRPIDGELRYKISITLPKSQIERLRQESVQQNLSISNLISELITKGYKR
ncbi:MAG: hypothetical protein ACI304_08980 [Lepagella sp.]